MVIQFEKCKAFKSSHFWKGNLKTENVDFVLII